jgi:putative RecB family exonuclease
MGTDMTSDTTARPERTVVDGVDVLGSLSPSRASDFMSCPLLFRFRTVDRLPEPFSPDAVRGTVVHRVLENLFDLPALDRTPARAAELVAPAWAELVAAEPEVAEMFGADSAGGPEIAAWLASCQDSLGRYFGLEDPTRLQPAEREAYVETLLDSKLLLRGFVDRLDVTPGGDIRVVDYKTGKAPGEGFEAKALFQMKFYALVIWRTRGVVPRMLQLIYLGSGELLRYSPDEQDLLATERKVEALWRAIVLARESGDWRPNRSALCGWCAHQSICPEWGGTPPPLPVEGPAVVEPDVAVAGGPDGPQA